MVSISKKDKNINPTEAGCKFLQAPISSASFSDRKASKFPKPLLEDSVIFNRRIKSESLYSFLHKGENNKEIFSYNKEQVNFYKFKGFKRRITTIQKVSSYRSSTLFYPWCENKRVIEVKRYTLPVFRNTEIYKRSKKPHVFSYNYTNFVAMDVISISLVALGVVPKNKTFIHFKPVNDKKLACNLKRAKKKARNIILSNWTKETKHTTLTYGENEKDFDKAKKHFNIFMKRLNRYWLKEFNEKVQYIWVAEKQERGAVHFHLTIFNHYLNEWQQNLEYNDYNWWFAGRFWGHGFARVTHKPKNKLYLVKYLTKSNDFSTEINKRIWSSSQGLKLTKPVLSVGWLPEDCYKDYEILHNYSNDFFNYRYCVQSRS